MEKYKKIYKGDVEITKIFVGNEKVWASVPPLPTGIMTFEDVTAKNVCVNNWGSGGKITYEQARAVTDIGLAFNGKANMVSFNELQYFTGITSIPDQAFRGCSELTSVTIPNSVTSISYQAFYYCRELTSIELPNNVTSISGAAFYNCDGLTTVTIPNSVISIGNQAFQFCRGLTSITIGNSVTSIGSSAFRSCTGLTSISIPNSVTSIGSSAFADCSGLTSVILNRTITPITTIGAAPFHYTSASLVIQVPQARLADYKTAANWSKYASKMVGY